MQKFEISGRLPGLNEYTNRNRTNKYAGNKQKKEIQKVIYWSIKQAKMKPISEPVRVKFIWHEGTKRRDKDNVASAKKFILDALQVAEVLPNDNNRYILGFTDEFVYDKTNRVQVILTGASEPIEIKVGAGQNYIITT